MSTPETAGGRAPACPICGKPVAADRAAQRFRPFCSARCAEIDLGRWFGETYRVPAEPAAGLLSDDDLSG
jgi:hypothetical protein